ncbi:MAG TPA: hypothetical protein VK883_01365, partial [Arthrobacter sp.]|nr:hypothetical protein [Arthrobacter sp.]
MWSHILGNPRAEWSIRIAECRRQVIGFAFFGPSIGPEGQELPRDRQLFSLYVTAERFGTGVGQALLDATAADGPAMLWVPGTIIGRWRSIVATGSNLMVRNRPTPVPQRLSTPAWSDRNSRLLAASGLQPDAGTLPPCLYNRGSASVVG